MMMVTRFLEFIVDLSYAVLFPTMLVLGLVLRMFFFSRKLGGMLVALALALIFVRAAAPILGGDTGEIMRMVAKLV